MTKEEFKECLGDLGVGETITIEPNTSVEEVERIEHANREFRLIQARSLYEAGKVFLD